MTNTSLVADQIDRLLNEKFKDAKITLDDLNNDGRHFSVIISSKEFAGKSLVAQHQMVYQALGDLMKKEIHALSITTKVPDR